MKKQQEDQRFQGLPRTLLKAEKALFRELALNLGVPSEYEHQDLYNYAADFLLRFEPKIDSKGSAYLFDSKARFQEKEVVQVGLAVNQKQPLKLESSKILESKDFGKYIDFRAFEKDAMPISTSLQKKNILEGIRGAASRQLGEIGEVEKGMEGGGFGYSEIKISQGDEQMAEFTDTKEQDGAIAESPEDEFASGSEKERTITPATPMRLKEVEEGGPEAGEENE